MPPKAKPKAKHSVSALSKAVRTHRHATPSAADAGTTCLDFRAAAAVTQFSSEDLGLSAGKRAPASGVGVKTVLAGESAINVEHRIRNATVPLGSVVQDEAAVDEDLSIEGFDASCRARRLMPRRPAWSFELSSGRLHHREAQAFKQWLADVRALIAERGGYPPAFEQNLQVWRQLWRVLERCDVAVVVIDARHPLLHLPPALVYHVARTLRKPLVVVLNKLDTVEPQDAARWAEVLSQGIPGVSGIVGYSKEHVLPEAFRPLEVGRDALIEVCHRALAGARQPDPAHAGGGAGPTCANVGGHATAAAEAEGHADADGAAAAGRIMLGLIGHPNVGKSSLVNSIMGGKVVSVKATPGHTKTLQTLVLDDRTCLCDSPGVVFPRLEVPREAQIVGMLIPLAQVREPFSALRWVMERAAVPPAGLLGLRPVTLRQVLDFREAGTDTLRLDDCDAMEEAAAVPWSPMLLCAQYAAQRGFVKGGRPDCTRAGMEILQRVLEGRVPYYVRPPATFSRPEGGGDAAGHGDAQSETDSDWQVDDDGYESEPEVAEDAGEGGLFETFGVEPRMHGGCTRRSKKRQEKLRKKRDEAAAEEAQAGDAEALPAAAVSGPGA